ncbi:MAG TPA: vanadium-dependent haloperoxidase [Puia sp.]|nr:vanadium-dependent haloperoxidase [Puia sp.]
MKKKLFISVCILILFIFPGCTKNNPRVPSPENYPADVAVAWMKLNIRLTLTTPGFNSVASDRSFSYAGLTLYESIAKGIRGSTSYLPQVSKDPILNSHDDRSYYWPASANAAMAVITKDLFGNASVADQGSIDSLEASFTSLFQSKAKAQDLQNAVAYGRATAAAIFDWSKTDGGHEAYLHVTAPGYVPPMGNGLWIPTPPAFGPPIYPFWGENRSFIPGLADQTQPPAPTPYSVAIHSPFYDMASELYTISLSLTHEDSIIAKFWADIPGNLNVPAHATNILTQLVVLNRYDLEKAAKVYAKHGIAMNEASISVFRTKYTYSLIRPISYIRDVLGHSTWNTVIPTPPHPEYSAAHAVVSAASAAVLEDFFGTNYHFSDHSYESSLGVRFFASFDAYAQEAGRSRLLGGIHYAPSIALGLVQGRKVGKMVNALSF